MIERVEDMPVYRLFFALAIDVEQATRNFGPDFRWLRVQSLRSSESVCANMTEGFYSQYSTEYIQGWNGCRKEARKTKKPIQSQIDVAVLDEHMGARLLNEYEESVTQLSGL